MVPGALIMESSAMFTPVSWLCLIALFYVALIGNIFSYWVWFKVLSMFCVTIASVGILMVPVIGVFSSSVMLSVTIAPWEIVALILVVSALSIIYFKNPIEIANCVTTGF